MVIRTLIAALFTVGMAAPGITHEFWIEPEQYQVESSAPVTAQLRNGEVFKGSALAYFERSTARFELIDGEGVRPVQPRMGDIPALETTAGKDGLLVVLHETTRSSLTYREWDKFLAFAAHKDFPDIAQRHAARGLPESGFDEAYWRYAKALVAVGDGKGSDRATGMATEFVALSNPYTDAAGDGMLVQLLYQGAARGDAQVEVFDKAPDGSVQISYLRTDADGQVRIPVTPGHDYLLDAVVLRPAPEDDTAVWETHWAALTFHVPR